VGAGGGPHVIMGRMNCLYSKNPFLMECSGGDPAYPFFEQFSSWPDRCEAIRWAVYLGLLPDNVSTHWIGSSKSFTGRDWMLRRPALAKIIAVLFEALMAILNSFSPLW